MRFKDYLEEASLSRVWQHTKGKGFAILSASKGDFTEKENKNRSSKLKTDLRGGKYGYFPVDGYWVNPDTKEVEGPEYSFFIPVGKYEEGEFLNGIRKLAKKYGQWSFMFKGKGDDIYEVKSSGGRINRGSFSPDKMGEAYSQLKSGPKKIFTFEKPKGK